MNPMQRFDATIARLYVSQGGPRSQRKMEQMMPWPQEEPPEATIDDFMHMLRTSARSKKGK